MKHFKQFLLLLVLAVFSTSGAWARERDLSKLESRTYYLEDGDVLYGTLKTKDATFIIDENATITLRNAKIDNITLGTAYPAIVCYGSCTIILEGTDNYLTGRKDYDGTAVIGGGGHPCGG